ncbi:hypothetical protein LBMAG42_21680 [Deltaproteobacteria bacterium]|nr:hypothetical protein LBMAG42_21680 [Deltaproteobacteria bacterium]
MFPDSQARSFEFFARLLRDDDREAVTHRLLTSCLYGPAGFGSLLPHLPDDLVHARWRVARGKRRSAADLDRAADALDLAAHTVRHDPGRCTAGCACCPVLQEGVQNYLSRTVGPLAVRLCEVDDPYYQHIGELLRRRLQPAWGTAAGPEPVSYAAAAGVPARPSEHASR